MKGGRGGEAGEGCRLRRPPGVRPHPARCGGARRAGKAGRYWEAQALRGNGAAACRGAPRPGAQPERSCAGEDRAEGRVTILSIAVPPEVKDNAIKKGGPYEKDCVYSQWRYPLIHRQPRHAAVMVSPR